MPRVRAVMGLTPHPITTQNFRYLNYKDTVKLASCVSQDPSVPPDPSPSPAPSGKISRLVWRCTRRIKRNRCCPPFAPFHDVFTRLCGSLFPPRGALASLLTLSLTTLSVFLAARTMLGPIAGPGGTVFALLVLIILALIGRRWIQPIHTMKVIV